MLSLLRFTLLSNLAAALLVALLVWLSDYVASLKLVDIMFLTGVCFWLVSTLIRLSSKRFKKEWNRDEVIVTDPQIVMHANSWALRFLIAGLPGIVSAIILGQIWY